MNDQLGRLLAAALTYTLVSGALPLKVRAETYTRLGEVGHVEASGEITAPVAGAPVIKPSFEVTAPEGYQVGGDGAWIQK